MNIEKYWYDSRYDYVDFIKRFPSKGWLFPCYNCELITGKKKVLTRLNFHKGSEIIIVPCCKSCKRFYLSRNHLEDKYIKKLLI